MRRQDVMSSLHIPSVGNVITAVSQAVLLCDIPEIQRLFC